MIDLNQTLVGLSLSQCVMSAVQGEVEIANIAFIVTSTKAHPYEDFIGLCQQYSARLWRLEQDKCVGLAMYLYGAKKIIQPRLTGDLLPAHHHGVWIPEAWKWHLA